MPRISFFQRPGFRISSWLVHVGSTVKQAYSLGAAYLVLELWSHDFRTLNQHIIMTKQDISNSGVPRSFWTLNFAFQVQAKKAPLIHVIVADSHIPSPIPRAAHMKVEMSDSTMSQ